MSAGFLMGGPASRQISGAAGDAFFARRIDGEEIEEGADLEEAAHLLAQIAQREAAASVLGVLGGDQQDTEAGAADISDAAEIDDEALPPLLDQVLKPPAELAARRAVDATPGLDDRDVLMRGDDNFHRNPLRALQATRLVIAC